MKHTQKEITATYELFQTKYGRQFPPCEGDLVLHENVLYAFHDGEWYDFYKAVEANKGS